MRLAADNNRSAVSVVLVEQILDVVVGGSCDGNLLGLLGFAVERRLIDLQLAFDDFSVRGNFIARLQEDNIAHHDLADVDFLQSAVADDLGAFLGFFLLLERGRLSLLTALADRRHAVGDDNRDENADRLVPLRLSHDEKHYLHDQRDKQNHDHRVLEAL